ITGQSFIGGTVVIDSGATMQWGSGIGVVSFLAGAGGSVIDNGALVLNFGGGGLGSALAVSGAGRMELQSGSLNDGGTPTYTGTTTIDAAGLLLLSVGGSIANSSNVVDNGTFDITGETAGASIRTLSGSGGVSVGSQRLTLTNASTTFSGVIS